MARINDEYDIGSAFAAIEDELIASMIRNMKRHKVEEVNEDKQWSMWQAEQLKALDKPTKQRIKAGIEGLTLKPPKGDIKVMQGYTDGRQRLRVGKYRVIYKYLTNGIEILYIMDIGSRGDIYK